MTQVAQTNWITAGIKHTDGEIQAAEVTLKSNIDALVDLSKRIAQDFEFGRCCDSRGAAKTCNQIDLLTERLRQLHSKRQILATIQNEG
jgi:regulation of enolase protein 1 (concanavalin A-like superfamily)